MWLFLNKVPYPNKAFQRAIVLDNAIIMIPPAGTGPVSARKRPFAEKNRVNRRR